MSIPESVKKIGKNQRLSPTGEQQEGMKYPKVIVLTKGNIKMYTGEGENEETVEEGSIFGDVDVYVNDDYESNQFCGSTRLHKSILGVCSETCTWYFDKEAKTIDIYGFDDMGLMQRIRSDDFSDIQNNLEKAIIHPGITAIGEDAFNGCIKLKEVIYDNVDENKVELKSINTRAFKDCVELNDTMVYQILSQGGERLEIRSSSFEGCNGLKNLIIPKEVTEMSLYTFSKCSELTTVKIEGKISKIGHGVFQNCPKLQKVDLEDCYSQKGLYKLHLSPINQFHYVTNGGCYIKYNSDSTESSVKFIITKEENQPEEGEKVVTYKYKQNTYSDNACSSGEQEGSEQVAFIEEISYTNYLFKTLVNCKDNENEDENNKNEKCEDKDDSKYLFTYYDETCVTSNPTYRYKYGEPTTDSTIQKDLIYQYYYSGNDCSTQSGTPTLVCSTDNTSSECNNGYKYIYSKSTSQCEYINVNYDGVIYLNTTKVTDDNHATLLTLNLVQFPGSKESTSYELPKNVSKLIKIHFHN